MNRVCSIAAKTAGAFLAIVSSAAALPNLMPYQPSGWSDKIIVSKTTGTTSDSSPLYTTDTLYVDWAIINNGSSATANTFYTALYVDGVFQTDWYSDPPVNANAWQYIKDYSIGSLSAGTHRVTITVDYTGVIAESNEGDNSYTKTIVVVTALPNLTPYRTPGWSDKIVVSKTAGTTADSSPLYTTDKLYVDWAIINNGSAATAVRFWTELYVDGVLKNSWYSDPPVNAGSWQNVLDYSIGALTAGQHTLKIKTDSSGAIAESGETDNEYTKTINVSAPNATPPSVSNVRAAQRAGTKLVDIYYDLADPASASLSVRILVSQDAGATWTVPAFTFSGANGAGVSPALNRYAVWNAGADWDGQYTTQCRVRVIASDAPVIGCDKIVFVSQRTGNWDVFSVKVDGSSLANLTGNPADDRTPAVSPGHDRIAFVSARDGNDEIYVMDTDGGNPTRLTNDPSEDGTPVWSPDGQKIAFVSKRSGTWQVYVMNADGTGLAVC